MDPTFSVRSWECFLPIALVTYFIVFYTLAREHRVLFSNWCLLIHHSTKAYGETFPGTVPDICRRCKDNEGPVSTQGVPTFTRGIERTESTQQVLHKLCASHMCAHGVTSIRLHQRKEQEPSLQCFMSHRSQYSMCCMPRSVQKTWNQKKKKKEDMDPT